VRLNVKYCTTGSCKTTTEIESKLTNARVEMAVLNNYVNFDNYDDPIETFIDDGFYWDLIPGTRKRTDIFVQNNYGKFQDGIFTFDNIIREHFFQITNSKERFSSVSSSNIVLSVYLRRDTQNIHYRRQVYTIVDSLARIGGFFRILTVIFEICLLLLVENLFYSKVVSNLYQLDPNHDRVYLTDSDNYESQKDGSSNEDQKENSLNADGGSRDDISQGMNMLIF
jgi:hypothetical protein